MKKILIIGATSAMAKALTRLMAAQGHQLYLAARNREHLETLAADLRVRGAAVIDVALFDATDFDSHEKLISDAIQKLGNIDIALLAHGALGDQRSAEKDARVMLQAFNVNALSTMSLLTHLSNYFEEKKQGSLVVISSVAGDRGRQSNYVYGAAKGALTIFLQGLRQRLYASHVHVMTVKPGFVDTPMTAHLEKNFLWASSAVVAADILRGIDKQKAVIYTPKFWRWIMMVVTHIPEWIFKKLKT